MSIDLHAARQFLARREQKAQKQKLARLETARGDAQRIIAMLVRDYHPRRIYQWGSLLQPDHFRNWSDIDLAVEGAFDAETFFRMFGEAQALTSFPLDLLDIDKIEPEFADIIRMKGRVVYERTDEHSDPDQ